MCIRDSHGFDLAVVLVKLLLEIIDAADRFVQRLLHHFGVGFATLQQVCLLYTSRCV